MMTPFPASPLDPPGTPGSQARLVLVVSCDPVIEELLFWMLSLSGYPVWLMTLEEALLYTESQERRSPALALLDSPGNVQSWYWKRLEQMRLRWPVPWLVLTNEPTSFHRFQQGLTVLGKPFHLHDLLRQVTQLLALAPLAPLLIPKTVSFHLGTVPHSIIYEEEQDARSCSE